MSVRITVGTQVIDFPTSGQDPNWAPAVSTFAEAVASQLDAIASPYDVPPKVQVLTSDTNVNLVVEDCLFPAGVVRSFTLFYAIYRTNTVNSVVVQGELAGVYDTLTSTWTLNDSFEGDRQSTGVPYQSFSMSGDQVVLSTVAIGGSYSSADSTISYSAKTQLEAQ